MKILTEIETVEKLLQGYSIARYGDGEILLCATKKKKSIVFQNYDDKLIYWLRQLVKMDVKHDKLLIAIPPQINGIFDNYQDRIKNYWKNFSNCRENMYFLNNLLNKNNIYASSFITRINEINNNSEIISKFLELWKNRKILYIINEVNKKKWETKLNNLFQKAEIVTYYYIPAKNAWDIHMKIFQEIISKYDKSYLILCSAGPTATVLAFFFTNNGYQFIDIGHFVELV